MEDALCDHGIFLGRPSPELDAQDTSVQSSTGAAWSQASLDGINRCTNVIFAVVSVPDVAGKVGLDYHNRLIFRQGQWCSDPLPKDGSCYDPSALALTSVFQNTDTGEILDADLEMNATDYTWGDFVAHPEQSNIQDFQGAITHEFGHVIGLSHTCFSPGGTFADGTLIRDRRTTRATRYPIAAQTIHRPSRRPRCTSRWPPERRV